MVWGTFGIVHFISLAACVGIIVGLYYFLKHLTVKTQIIILGILSFSGIGAIIFNLLSWNSPLEYLPFHLCSLGALVLPIATFTRNKVIANLLLLWSLGAFFAILLNHAAADFEILSWTFFFFYFPHVLEMGIPILLFKLGLTKLDKKCVITTVGITMASYTVIHFINLIINAFCVKNNIVDYAGNLVKVNYMYSLVPENPMLAFIWSIIPFEYWYMYGVIPIAVVYLGAIYSVHHFITKRKAMRCA